MDVKKRRAVYDFIKWLRDRGYVVAREGVSRREEGMFYPVIKSPLEWYSEYLGIDHDELVDMLMGEEES